jgi:hypothetical protein
MPELLHNACVSKLDNFMPLGAVPLQETAESEQNDEEEGLPEDEDSDVDLDSEKKDGSDVEGSISEIF